MKKELLYFAMLALTLTGCRSEEDLTDTKVPVKFGVEVKDPQVETRASVTDLSSLKTDGFCLYAVMTDASTGHLTPYMTNQDVKWESDGWTYSPMKYWPDSDQEITFYAVQKDPNGNLQRATDWDYSPALTYTNPTEMSQQTDLLWAPAVTASKESVNGAVQFSFQHALAAFRFCAKKESSLGEIYIQKIELTGYFPQQAQLLSDAESVDQAWYFAGKRQLVTYTLQNTADGTEPAALSSAEVTTTLLSVQKETSHLLTVIPVSSTSYTLKVYYTLDGAERSVTYTSSDSVQFQAGHVYQLNMVFGDTTTKVGMTES